MTDLDRKIAILKGWIEVQDPHWDRPGWRMETPVGACTIFPYRYWSEDEGEAWKLVDELKGLQFLLSRGSKGDWIAILATEKPVNLNHILNPVSLKVDGRGPTRSEAICRAYISAKTWISENGGGR